MKKLLVLFILIYATSSIAQKKKIEVFNTSINSKYAEIGAKYLGNSKLIFASSKKNKDDISFKKNRRKNNRQLFLDLYIGIITDNGDIIQSNKFYTETDNKFSESDLAFTSDLKTVYFTWNNYYNIVDRKDSTNWRTFRIVKASIDDNYNISNIKELPINSQNFSNKNPVLNKDETKLYFVSDRDSENGETDIFEIDIFENNTYGTPKKLDSKINSEGSEIFPFVDDNNMLYFSSNGHKGIGGYDIYRTTLNNEKSEIELLPSPINSSFDDIAFIIDNSKNKGFFTSNRKDSKGDVDIYSFRIKTIEPKDIVENITSNKNNSIASINNNAETEIIKPQKHTNSVVEAITVENNNKIASINNDVNTTILEIPKRKSTAYNVNFGDKTDNVSSIKNIGNTEIVAIEKATILKTIDSINKYEQELKELECIQTIELISINEYTLEELKGIRYIIKNTTDNQDVAYNSKLTNLNCNTKYSIEARKKGYHTSKINIETSSTKNENRIETIILKPLICKRQLAGIIVDVKTNRRIPRAIVTIYKENKIIEQVESSNTGSFKFEADCNSNYSIMAMHPGYLQDKVKINTSLKNKDLRNINLKLKEEEKEITATINDKFIKTKPIEFELNQAEINEDIAIELTKVIRILNKFPTIKLEIKSHTDSRAPDAFNLRLSNERAQSIISYIISKGIDTTRVFGKGYGETQLLNKCKNGVKCTEIEHQKNRRTEFLIIR